jgi:hypothetical protein
VFTLNLSAVNCNKRTVGCGTGGGTATPTTDYAPQQGTATIAARLRSTTIRVPVVGDTTVEADETSRCGSAARRAPRSPTTPASAPSATTTRTAIDPRLTVVKAGAGTGTVTSNLGGINCDTDCTETYGRDSTITLSAAADPGSILTGWSGPCTGSGAC